MKIISVIFFFFLFLLDAACSGMMQTFTHRQILKTEARDETSAPPFELVFDRLTRSASSDSVVIFGKTQWSSTLSDSGCLQFGLWRVEEEGAYFIVRAEYAILRGQSFEIHEKILNDEWLVIETPAGARFFNIRNLWHQKEK